jgi:multimeric flavodoxin WrbA
MKILSLLGSARKKGNTATVLSWVEAELQTIGHEIDRIHLPSKQINGCLGCGKCKEIPDQPGCVQKDDGLSVIGQMVESDAVIYASPLYYWGFTAHMKALIDRSYCLYRGACGTATHTSFVEGQRQALLVTAADAFENNTELVITSFLRALVYSKAKPAGELMVCNSTTPEELGEEIREQAGKFARQIFNESNAPYALMIPGGAQ